MIEQFEFHIKQLIMQMKKLFIYGIYLTTFFIFLFTILIILKLYDNYFGVIIFVFLMIILFFSEILYGFFLYSRYKSILINYKIDKEKCLDLLSVRIIKYENYQVDIDTENLSFAMKYYIHAKKAYEILKNLH